MSTSTAQSELFTTGAAPAHASHELLAQAERAYEAGNIARMRELCAKLSAGADHEVAQRAAALMARVSVDPLALFVLLGSLLLFGVIVHAYMF